MKYEYLKLNSETRKSLEGSFIKLTDGYTHYEIKGPEDAEVIVLVHGFSVAYFAWDKVFPALLEQGYRVLRYDVFGRGYSDRPEVDYTLELYVRQLYELITKLKLEKINLLGWSMGGAIAVTFSDKYPQLVQKLSLLAPTGFPYKLPIITQFLKIPGLNKVFMKTFGKKILPKRSYNMFVEPQKFPNYLNKFKKQMAYKGYLRAILSTLNHTNMHHLEEEYERVGQLQIPKQLVWGSEDKVSPYKNRLKVMQSLPGVVCNFIEGAGHILHYENTAEYIGYITDFFGKKG